MKLQLMVPKTLRDKVLNIAHCSLLSAHLGIKKTHDKIVNDFYFNQSRYKKIRIEL